MAEDDDESPKTADSKEDKAARMNSAKAFYRAMYAGAEPDPEEFGIDLGAPKQQGGNADNSGSQAAVLHLQEQLKETEAKALEWENLYKRIVADFDNFKKRMDRERDEMQSIGMQKALEAILPGLDDLDMAQSKLTESSDPKVMLQSFKMILARFNKCLEQVGIKQMQVIGDPFDPRFHEPIQEVHTAEFPEGAVVQQLRPGYLFGEKVLRPTLVNVATAPLDGPGYQPPVPGSEAAPAAEVVSADAAAPADKVSVSEEEVVAASQAAEKNSEPVTEDSAQSTEAKTASEAAESDTSEVLAKVGYENYNAEQFATQDIPLKEFKTSLEADAAAAASAQSASGSDGETSDEKTAEEAVASAEES